MTLDAREIELISQAYESEAQGNSAAALRMVVAELHRLRGTLSGGYIRMQKDGRSWSPKPQPPSILLPQEKIDG